MRKTIFILGLVAATWLATTNDAAAQRVRFGGGRGVSVDFGGRGGGWNGRNYGWGGRNYGWGNGYYGGRSYYGSYYPRYYGNAYSPSYYYSTPYYSTPTYYYSDPVVQVPTTEYRQSFYSDPNSSTITVLLPNADAQVWFDDSPTTQRGMERIFNTPSLQQAGTYSIKARWTEGGRTVDRQRDVQVQPGQPVTVNFRTQ